jgi:hypothetical protein
VPPLERRIQKTVQRIRQLSGFEDFMQPKSMERLKQAAIDGPVVIVNVRSSRCHALIVKSSGQVECVPLADNLTREFATILARAVQMLCDGAVSPFPFSIQNSERRVSDSSPNHRLFGKLEGPSSNEGFGVLLEVLWYAIAKPVIDTLSCRFVLLLVVVILIASLWLRNQKLHLGYGGV